MLRVDEIVARLGGECFASATSQFDAGAAMVRRIAPLETAQAGDLAFCSNAKYRSRLAATHASVVVMAPPAIPGDYVVIVTPQPYRYYARVAQWLNPPSPIVPGVHASAIVEGAVSESASIGANVWIGPGAVIEAGVEIGANSSIGANVTIGEQTRLAANVTIYAGCRVGRRCLVHAGAVIGADGFGFAREGDGSWLKIPQIGRVSIEDDVEIGAGTTIDRGALDDTVIEQGVKLDNQIQVGHNVRIGAHTAIAGCVGIAGSATIGKRCTVGGASVILGHLQIADDVNIMAGTLIAKSIPKSGNYSGAVPFMEHADWLRNFARVRHLDAMAVKLRSLEQRLAELENK